MTRTRRRLLRDAAAAALVAGCGLGRTEGGPTAIRIGYLAIESGPGGNPYVGALRQGLREIGWIEGDNLTIDYRLAQGRLDRVDELARDLASDPPDVIVAASDRAVHAAMASAGTTPIIAVGSTDPVRAGIVSSLARPGGNVTGLSLASLDLAMKRLEFFHDTVAGLSRVAVLWNADTPDKAREHVAVQAAAGALRLELRSIEARSVNDISSAFARSRSVGGQALLVLNDALTFTNQGLIAFLATQTALPTMFEVREFADTGGLMSYGPNLASLHRRAALYVDKIVKGARPSDLPIERPTRLELVVNLRHAESIGLAVPRRILLQADEVLQ